MSRVSRPFVLFLLSIFIFENFAVLPVFAETPMTQDSASDREALIWIDHRLRHIESTTRNERIVSGVTLLGLGAAAGIGAGIAAGSSDPSWNSTGAVLLGVTGGVFALTGALILALPGDGEKLPQNFQDLPEGSALQIRTKIVTGESYLSSISNQARDARLIGAASLFAVAGGELGLYAIRQGDPFYKYTNNDYLIYLSIISAAMGVVTLLNKTDAEKAHSDYELWKGTHRKSGLSGVIADIKPGFSPIPSGGMATLSLKF